MVGEAAAHHLGPFEVCATAAAIAAYRAATVPAATGPAVPLALTLRWLTMPAVRTALADLLAADEVMVHEAQKFGCAMPLQPDVTYLMRLHVVRTSDPARVTANASVTTRDGVPVLDIETVLRLVTPPASPT